MSNSSEYKSISQSVCTTQPQPLETTFLPFHPEERPEPKKPCKCCIPCCFVVQVCACLAEVCFAICDCREI